jgi:AraC-like DNA-binding protein
MPTVDVLSQVAEVFRLRGSLSGVRAMNPPWAFEVPASKQVGLLVVIRGRVHLEASGTSHAALDLAAGDVVAMPHGHALVVRDDPRTPVPAAENDGCCGWAEGPEHGQTEIIGLCCELAGGRANPLLRVLPPLIHCPGTDGRVARWLDPTVRLLAAESATRGPGRTTILDRLAEVVFIQLIRSWIESLPAGEGGWLAALGDARLAGALEAIHSDPGGSWTLESLASRATMSRSAFAGRFKQVVGETPLGYLTRWRMQRAASLLETDDMPLKEIVGASGYASEAAFRNAFRKWVGETPARYRERARMVAV